MGVGIHGTRHRLHACLVIAGLLFTPGGAIAGAWPPDGSPVCTATGDQLDPILIAPGVAIWNDHRYGSSAIYLRPTPREYARGPWWSQDEIPVYAGPGDASAPRAIPYSGSVLVTWSDTRNGAGNADVHVQRLTGSGIWPGYIQDGIPVCTAAGAQVDPSIADDGAGGYFIAWSDGRNATITGSDIYLQHFHEYGQAWDGWPAGGVAICDAPGDQLEPVVVADGNGGALVFWRDRRTGSSDIYGIAVSAIATTPASWTPEGNPVSRAPGEQWQLRALPDAAGGACLAWMDARDGTPQLYAGRITANGATAPGWPADGIPVSMSPQEAISAAALCSADSGGIFTAWAYRGKGLSGIRAQRLLAEGVPARGWPPGGRIISETPSPADGVAAMPDGNGGVFVAWNHYWNGTDIRALRLRGDGGPEGDWPAAGVVLTQAEGQQLLPGWSSGQPPGGAMLPDGEGGAIAAWTDARRQGDLDIYAQRVTGKGVVAPAYPPFCIECVPDFIDRVYPNPARGAITVRAWVPEDGGAWVEVVDIRGVLRRTQRCAQPGPLYRSIPVDLQGLPAGVYFLQYRTGSTESGPVFGRRRVVLVH